MRQAVSVFAVSTFVLIVVVLAVTATSVWCRYTQQGAVQRAEALLRQHLTTEELLQLDKTGALSVHSNATAGRVYVVPVNGFVTVLDGGSQVMRLCIRPVRLLPGRESVLAHKMHIEAAEEDYMRRATVVWRAMAPTT